MPSHHTELDSTTPHKSLIYAWEGVIVYVTQDHLNKAHAHFPALLQIGLGTAFALAVEDQPASDHEVVVMAPNISHSTDSQNQPYIAILIDPDHALYVYLHPLLNRQAFCSLPAARLKSFQKQFQQLMTAQLCLEQVKQLVMDVLLALNPQPLKALPWDQRIQLACEYIKRCVPHQIPTIADVALQVGLSESRLMHLFSQQLGLSMRQYILWLRIRYAIKLWMQGKTLIEIAVESGFSDQAHFTRTLRRMVDFAPSMLKANTVFMSA
ncbi:helix-turn-helix transcriptional regulator [Acinetobacter modestus]|uniref:helix-turn-helix transcriptional regulator n=1 Tax=Acinetobacter modestus TaxID=1776740 RepID=UPI003B971C3C